MNSIKRLGFKQTCFQLRANMKLTLILLLFLWDNVDFTLTNEAITCKLNSIPPEGTTYNPQNQVIFRVGETVTVSCGEKHFVKSTELSSAELTCQDTGNWDFEPVCKPVTCSKYDEHIKHVQRWRRPWFDTVRMNETLWYWCLPNYVKTSPTAKCTRRGWEPDPLCEEISCPKPALENFEVEGAKTEYKKDEILRYSCNSGYRKVNESLPQCKKVGESSQWTPVPQCEPITCKLSTDSPEATAYIFRPGETVTVSCGEKLWVKSTELSTAVLTCQDTGEWDFEPVCKPVTCFKHAEHVHGGRWTRLITARMDETWSYRCHRGYLETSPTGIATCTRRGWEPDPLCKEPHQCESPPSLENGDFFASTSQFDHNTRVKYQCQSKYKMQGGPYKTCLDGVWTGDITCLKPCTLNSDLLQPNKIRFRYGAYDKLYIQHEESTTFECIQGATHDGNVAMRQICNNGEMALPRCV